MTRIPTRPKEPEPSICAKCHNVSYHHIYGDTCTAWGACPEVVNPVSGEISYNGIVIDYNGAKKKVNSTHPFPLCDRINTDGLCDRYDPLTKLPVTAFAKRMAVSFAWGLAVGGATSAAPSTGPGAIAGITFVGGEAGWLALGVRVDADPNAGRCSFLVGTSILAGILVGAKLTGTPNVFELLMASPALAGKAKAVLAPTLLEKPLRDVKKLLQRKSAAAVEIR
jgi:hypothetical protein